MPGHAARGLWVFGLLLGAYHLNGGFQEGHDATGHVYLPLQLLEHGQLSFRPEQAPLHFSWQRHTPEGPRVHLPLEPDPALAGRIERGELSVAPHYYLQPTARPGQYANTFGIGPGLYALPFYAAASLAVDDLQVQPEWMWGIAKLAAAAAVAGTGLLIFLIGLRLAPPWAALAAALVYGLGTCAWSISSQTLWQHGPNGLFLALGIYGLVRADERRVFALLSGSALGFAVLCRPDSALYVAAVGAYLLWSRRALLLPFTAAAAVPLLGLLAYNLHFFRDPFVLGQVGRARMLALAKTGSPELWSTPLHEGLAGILLSPSRGLFVYSPILLLSLWGATRAVHEPRWMPLRPLLLAVLGIWVASALHFDWWSGWSYGYRHIVDTAPVLALLLLPLAERARARPGLLTLAAGLCVWSVGVQALGAAAYDLVGWNQLEQLEVQAPGEARARVLIGVSRPTLPRDFEVLRGHTRDVDAPAHRHRLWSFSDWQIAYYAANFGRARLHRQRRIELWTERFRNPRERMRRDAERVRRGRAP